MSLLLTFGHSLLALRKAFQDDTELPALRSQNCGWDVNTGAPVKLACDENGHLLTIADYTCVVYQAGTTKYYCYAPPGSSINAALWAIKRVTYSAGSFSGASWANGEIKYDKTASAYAGYIYS